MKKQNIGINNFRVIAAIMVVAIHCYPFRSFFPLADMVFTLTLFRIAVPFFFMVSGFYILGQYEERKNYATRQKVINFIKKQLKVYALVSVLYLPLSLYTKTISLSMPLKNILQGIFFESFMYHLWYFPALILGTSIVAFLLQIIDIKWVLAITGLLYIIGLGGDSWSGVFGNIEMLKPLYKYIFIVFGGTRNGIFFAPLYLSVGTFLYHRKDRFGEHKKSRWFVLIISLVCLLVEGYVLQTFFAPNHTSMYLFLPLVMLSLFPIIYRWHPKHKIANADYLSFGIYVLHPYSIAIIHFAAKKIQILNNSLLFFIVVLFITTSIVLVVSWLKHKKISKKIIMENSSSRASKILSEKAIVNNLKEIQTNISPKTKVMAILKANGYGTSAPIIAKILVERGVDFFAVATIDEAIALRKNGVAEKILILGYTSPKRIKELANYSLIQTIVSEEHALALSAKKVEITCHIKVDTGMHRLGVEANSEKIALLYKFPFLNIQGIYSHLACADELTEQAVQRTKQQIRKYNFLIEDLKQQQIDIGITHLQSSYGIVNYPELEYDYVRPGIILYGMLSNESDKTKLVLNLNPVVKICAQLVCKHKVSAGESVGYGCATKLNKDTMVGIVSIGYCDGVPRELKESNFFLFINGQPIPQIGRICMDMVLVDLTLLPETRIETEIVVLQNIEKIATSCNTITNEVLSRLGNRFDTKISYF